MTSRGISNDEIRRRAQVRSDKADQRKVDALNSLKSQQAIRDAEQAKTLRLRALRLAKEKMEALKSDADSAAATPKASRKKKAASPAKGAQDGPFSLWDARSHSRQAETPEAISPDFTRDGAMQISPENAAI